MRGQPCNESQHEHEAQEEDTTRRGCARHAGLDWCRRRLREEEANEAEDAEEEVASIEELVSARDVPLASQPTNFHSQSQYHSQYHPLHVGRRTKQVRPVHLKRLAVHPLGAASSHRWLSSRCLSCCCAVSSLIEYPSKEDVDNALRKLDDTKLDGAVVRLYEVKKDSAAGSSGGGSGGGNRGRSRSRSPPPRRDRSHSPRRSRSRSPRRDDRGSRGTDRDDRRDRSRSRSPRRDRSRSPARETSNSGNGGSSSLVTASNGGDTAEAAAPKSPKRE